VGRTRKLDDISQYVVNERILCNVDIGVEAIKLLIKDQAKSSYCRRHPDYVPVERKRKRKYISERSIGRYCKQYVNYRDEIHDVAATLNDGTFDEILGIEI